MHKLGQIMKAVLSTLKSIQKAVITRYTKTKGKRAYKLYKVIQIAKNQRITSVNEQFMRDNQILVNQLIDCKTEKKIIENMDKMAILLSCKNDTIELIQNAII